ncbi:MAG TPA: trypsin-like peptidase domain-containing protein [Mycobacteriales bacterium]|nr:trypsin-like peptidase domain-containing protein [Mycobacteriales bacterium]
MNESRDETPEPIQPAWHPTQPTHPTSRPAEPDRPAAEPDRPAAEQVRPAEPTIPASQAGSADPTAPAQPGAVQREAAEPTALAQPGAVQGQAAEPTAPDEPQYRAQPEYTARHAEDIHPRLASTTPQADAEQAGAMPAGPPTWSGQPPAGWSGPYAGPGPWAGQPVTAPPKRRRGTTAAIAGTLALAVGFGGIVIGRDLGGSQTVAGSGTSSAGSATTGQFGTGGGNGPFGGFGTNGGTDGGTGTGSGTGTSTTRAATTAESAGVVDITTVLSYGTAEAAGTGIVLTSNGEILTNNHVVDEATKITVTVVSTGRSYTATVVGTDATDDVAVLQLSGASGLTTATLSTDTAAVGDAVTAVGNAGGTGGTPTAAEGSITALNQSITASDETGTDSEQLTGLIQVDAAVQAGDSGGPLYSDGAVIGIDTAASSSGQTVGFAIPIATALAIADRIESGESSATITQGTPAFLGVELANGTTGATISGTVSDSPAAKAGLAEGDTITAVDGSTVDSSTALSAALAKHAVGDQVRLTWTDTSGTSHTATVTLIAGPAD